MREKGGTPILVSLTPRNRMARREDRTAKRQLREMVSRGGRQKAAVEFVDLHNITADALDRIGQGRRQGILQPRPHPHLAERRPAQRARHRTRPASDETARWPVTSSKRAARPKGFAAPCPYTGSGKGQERPKTRQSESAHLRPSGAMAVSARFRSFRRCAADSTEPCRLQHAAVLCGEHSSTCRTVLEYFAESTIQHSATHSPIFCPAALPRRGQPSGQRGRSPYPPHKKNQDTNPFPAWRPQKRPITPNQPHAPLGTNHLPRSRFRDEASPRHPFHTRPSVLKSNYFHMIARK